MDERDNTTVMHYLHGTFPLDRSFFGETFVVGEHVIHSALQTAVSSSLNRGLPREAFDLQAILAKEAFDTTILSGTPDSAYGKVSRLPKRIKKERFTQPRREARGVAEDFGKFLGDSAEKGPVMLDVHYPPKGNVYSSLSAMKRMFGDSLNFSLHLHCLADLYCGNPNTSRLTEVEKGSRKSLKSFVEKFNPQIIAVSEAVRNSFYQQGLFEGIHVIRNGVSSDLYKPVSDEEKQKFIRSLEMPVDQLVGYSGKLNDVKGFPNLVEVLKYYNSEGSDKVGFLLASSGGKRFKERIKELEEAAPRLVEQDRLKVCMDVSKLTRGIQDKDVQIGEVYKDNLNHYGLGDRKIFAGVVTVPVQPRLSVYFHPTNSEAIGLSVIEAAMSGVPVVASCVGGIPEAVNYNNGTLVDIAGRPLEDLSSDFVDAIEDWRMRSPDREYAERTRENIVRAGFDSSKMASDLDRIYSLK